MCTITAKINQAKESIILIDDVVDEETIGIIEDIKPLDVPVKIFSKNKFFVNVRNIKRRKNFLSGFSYYETNVFRDRYLLIDNKYLYILTRPLKYDNKRRFNYIRVMGEVEIVQIRRRIVECEELHSRKTRHF